MGKRNSVFRSLCSCVILFCFSSITGILLAQSSNEPYEKKQFKVGNQTLNYRILSPMNFDSTKKYPLVVFLHGMGERGVDNNSQLAHGSKLFLDSLEKYPAFYIFPQCPTTDYWSNLSRPDKGGRNRKFDFHSDKPAKPTLDLVIKLVEKNLQKQYIDTDRIYVSGLSMGGFGTWELLWRMPQTFAAAAPICGGGDPKQSNLIGNVALWAFHGVADDVVHPRMSMQMVKAVQKSGGKAKISLYQDVNHNSWDSAFAEQTFLSWMFSKRKK